MKQIAGALRSLRSGEGLKGQLMRGGVGSVAVKIASTLLNVLMAIVLARLLGVEGFGVYSFVFAVVTIMAIPAQMGLPNLVVRETAKAQVEGRWDVMKGLWRWASLIALAISLGLIIAGVLIAWLFSARFSLAELATFYWGLALVPLIALGNLRGAALRGLRYVVRGQLPEFVLRPVFLISLVLIAHLGLAERTLTASDAMMLHAVASLAAFAIGAAMLLRARPEELTNEPIKTTQWRPWLVATLPLAAVGGIQLINQQVGIIAVGVFATASEVGVFRVASQGATMVSFGLLALNLMVGSHFARLYTEGRQVTIQRLATKTAQASALLSIPIFLIYVLFGREIISILFGDSYVVAYRILLVISIGYLVSSFTGSVGVLLNMTGNEKFVIYGVGVAAMANILLSLILIPIFGIIGAAVATTSSMVIWNIILVFAGVTKLGILSLPIASVRYRVNRV